MSRNIVETLLGAVVLLVAFGFLFWAYTRSNLTSPDGYLLSAAFDRIDGLEIGSDVRVSGIRVGKVVEEKLDLDTYRAEVVFSVRSDVRLPRDSSAAIVSSGLLGSKYLSIIPGAEEDMLPPGGRITFTQPPVNLEDLLGRFIFGSQQEGETKP